jgi:hypothetical protein
MTINRLELLAALTKEGVEIQYKDLAFTGEDSLYQGVRLYTCKSGRKYLTFACGQSEVINALFFESITDFTQSIPCQNIDQIIKFMNKPTEEKKSEKSED